MYDSNSISTLLDVVSQNEINEEKCQKVIALIKNLQITDFTSIINEINSLSNSVSLTYSLEDVNFYLRYKGIGEHLTLEDKMEILNDFVGNVSSYGTDYDELLPLCIKDHIESLNV